MSKSSRSLPSLLVLAACIFSIPQTTSAAQPDPQMILAKSVQENQIDFQAAPEFSYKERDSAAKGSKTYQVTMIDGSPYQRLIAIDDQPLSKQVAGQQEKKQEAEISRRKAESSEERQKRIGKYEKDRRRDNAMMQQLTQAFTFKLVDERTLDSHKVYLLRATPRPGYQPPNLETQVLPGMQGQLWIDQATYQWVKVTARVIHPVSIEGFLAQVQPGTQFELEKMPVENGVWQPKHFAVKSQAKVLFLFNHNSHDEETYFDYQRSK